MCVLSIKVPLRKKSGKLFNDPRISSLIKAAVPHKVNKPVIFKGTLYPEQLVYKDVDQRKKSLKYIDTAMKFSLDF